MDLRVVVPVQLKLKAFQVEYSQMDNIVEWMNINFGLIEHYEVVLERFIARISKDNTVKEYIVNGDWIIIDGTRVEVLSNSDFNKRYREMR